MKQYLRKSYHCPNFLKSEVVTLDAYNDEPAAKLSIVGLTAVSYIPVAILNLSIIFPRIRLMCNVGSLHALRRSEDRLRACKLPTFQIFELGQNLCSFLLHLFSSFNIAFSILSLLSCSNLIEIWPYSYTTV